MLGFLKTKRWLSLSSAQSISLPMMLKRALLSMSTLTPSCSTASSKAPGLSTYSRWYASPLQPRFRTPTLMSLGSGWSSIVRSCSTAAGVSFMAALRARSLGRARAGLGAADGTDVAGRLEPLQTAGAMLAAVHQSLLPAALTMGLTTSEAAQRWQDQLADDIRDHGDHTLLWPLLIGAWKRKDGR